MAAMVQVIGPSGSGKTLALEGAVRRLRRRGLRVAVLKHSHHSLEVAGKDTDRLRRSGANIVVFASDQSVVFSDWDPVELASVLPVDVVLIEGFGRERFRATRFVVRDPSRANAISAEIDRAIPDPPAHPRLLGDGAAAPAGELWELVGNLMRRAGIAKLELLDGTPLITPRVGRGRSRRPRARRKPRETGRRRSRPPGASPA